MVAKCTEIAEGGGNAMTEKERRNADTLEMIRAVNANAERKAEERVLENMMIEQAILEKRARRKSLADNILAGLMIGSIIAAFMAFMWTRTDAMAMEIMSAFM